LVRFLFGERKTGLEGRKTAMEKHFGHYKWKEKPCRRGWNPGEIDWL